MSLLRFCLFSVLFVAGLASASAQAIYLPSGTSGIGSSLNGNIGVGAASPLDKLSVHAGHGDTRFSLFSDYYGQGVDGANTALLTLWASEPNWTWSGVGIGNNVRNSNGIVRATSARGASYVRLLSNEVRIVTIDSQGADRLGMAISNGNVGIGISEPAAKLDIFEDGQHLTFLTNKKLVGSWPASPEATTMTIQSSGASAGNLAFATGNSEWLRITQHGNVGIGTSSPGGRLTVTSNVPAVGSYLQVAPGAYGLLELGIPSSVDNKAFLSFHRGGAVAYQVGISGHALVFAQTGGPDKDYLETEVFRISAGNVGIGTANPAHKLSVNGTGKFKEVIVDTTGWSDYVFAPDYELAPLSEVEAHIKEHQHLPGIPSATEVAEQGVSVGEIQAKLLAKIEELTLHVIAQDKAIQGLRTENTELRRAIGLSDRANRHELSTTRDYAE